MLQEATRTNLRVYGTLVGRVLMGLLFFFSGVGILMSGPASTATYFASLGIPLAGLVVWLVLAIKIVAGGALMLGYRVGAAAALLILFTAAAILAAHMDMEDPGLWKNLAIIGGLLYVIAYGAGDGWKV